MKLFLKINGETFAITRPDEEDKNLSFWDMYALFYKLTRMSGHCTDEIDSHLNNMEKDIDKFLKSDLEIDDGLGF